MEQVKRRNVTFTRKERSFGPDAEERITNTSSFAFADGLTSLQRSRRGQQGRTTRVISKSIEESSDIYEMREEVKLYVQGL